MQTIKTSRTNTTSKHRLSGNTKHSRKTRKTRKTRTTRKTRKTSRSKKSNTLTSILDFKKSKSLTILSKTSDIKSITSVGEFYNLLDIHDNINKNCINKVKTKVIDGIQLNKQIGKTICNCLFEKNKDLTIEKLEADTNKKIHTPGSSCISIIDKFIKEEQSKMEKNKSSKSSKSSNKSK